MPISIFQSKDEPEIGRGVEGRLQPSLYFAKLSRAVEPRSRGLVSFRPVLLGPVDQPSRSCSSARFNGLSFHSDRDRLAASTEGCVVLRWGAPPGGPLRPPGRRSLSWPASRPLRTMLFTESLLSREAAPNRSPWVERSGTLGPRPCEGSPGQGRRKTNDMILPAGSIRLAPKEMQRPGRAKPLRSTVLGT